MLTASYRKHTFIFKQPAGTSRGTLNSKTSWFLFVQHAKSPDVFGVGECSILPKLSIDDRPDYETVLQNVCNNITKPVDELMQQLTYFPSIRFGLETALLDLQQGGKRLLFDNDFSAGRRGIAINGLIWMGSREFMLQQITKRLDEGFRCLKMKIGAIGFETEYEILKNIRQQFTPDDLELRVDANGAFSPAQATQILQQLASLHIHSIEQPIRQGHIEEMAQLCSHTPIPIALDEELIGVQTTQQRQSLLQQIKPQYIILKPSLLGGWHDADEWVQLAQQQNIGWWATSALEGNIGLNAIAQWTAHKQPDMLQGLGTGSLFTNNILSPLYISKGHLHYNPQQEWHFS